MLYNFKRDDPYSLAAEVSLSFFEKNVDTEIFCHDPMLSSAVHRCVSVEWVQCCSLLLSHASHFLRSLVQGGALRRRDGFYEDTPVSLIMPDTSAKDMVKVLYYLNGGEVLFSSAESLDAFTSLLENLGINVRQEGRESFPGTGDQKDCISSLVDESIGSSKIEFNENVEEETDTIFLEKNNNSSLSSDGISLTGVFKNEICEKPSSLEPPPNVEITANPKQVENESAIPDEQHPMIEVDKDNSTSTQFRHHPRSIYDKFFYLPDDCPPPESMYKGKLRKSLRCSLCDKTGLATWVSFGNRSIHMRRFHLPDEECELCGEMVRPIDLYNHTKKLCKNRDKLPVEENSVKENCHHCQKSISKSNYPRHVRNCLKRQQQ